MGSCVVSYSDIRKSCMLTAKRCVSLRSGWGTYCVVCNGDFTFCVSVYKLVLVCPEYVRNTVKRSNSAGANNL